jgi:hypothetical protein
MGRRLGKRPFGKPESTCLGKIKIDFKETVCGQGNEKLCSVIWGGVISRLCEELLASHGGMWYMEKERCLTRISVEVRPQFLYRSTFPAV